LPEDHTREHINIITPYAFKKPSVFENLTLETTHQTSSFLTKKEAKNFFRRRPISEGHFYENKDF